MPITVVNAAPAGMAHNAFLEFRTILQQRLKRATTGAYGPRFLHSTGQYHKGGPNAGLFIQLTTDGVIEMNVPGKNYLFGPLSCDEADGDFTLMLVHSRRIIRVDLNGDIYPRMEKADRVGNAP